MTGRVDENGAAYAGSQLQTQLYVNRRVEQLNAVLTTAFPELAAASVTWRSPLASDHYREYWDASFLQKVGLGHLAEQLKAFWPTGGPRWDALATVEVPGHAGTGVILAEGKSYPDELYGRGSAAKAGSTSRELIETSLAWTQKRCGVHGKTAADWCGRLYQSANRLAHLAWLQSVGVDAWLVHLLFTGDPHQPTTETEWSEALEKTNSELGLDGVSVERVGHVLLAAGPREELIGDGASGLSRDEDTGVVERLPDRVWKRVAADPANTAHYLALAAVERFGSEATASAQQLRAEHPESSRDELAEIVKSRHVRLARYEGAAAGLPPSLAPLVGSVISIPPDLAMLAWIQCRMVMHVAAIYERDMTHPDRAAELLVLQGFYNSTEAARTAVAQAGERVAKRLVLRYLKGPTLIAVKQFARAAGVNFSRAAVLRALPFIAVPLSAAVNAAATRSLANRAINYYR